MEPIHNIDKQIREKLASREITPSEKSWDRLDAMLSVAEKPKKNYGWMYIAAACAGFLLIATVFFRQSEEMIDKGTEKVVFEMPQSIQESEGSIDQDPAPAAGSERESNTTQNHSHTPVRNVSHLQNNQLAAESTNQATDHNTAGPDQASQSKTIINQKIEQSEIARKPAYINVDELLASVDGSAKTPVVLTGKSGITVHSGDLLSQVDGELELSFRERVIKGVNKNFKAVKVALANRNNE